MRERQPSPGQGVHALWYRCVPHQWGRFENICQSAQKPVNIGFPSALFVVVHCSRIAWYSKLAWSKRSFSPYTIRPLYRATTSTFHTPKTRIIHSYTSENHSIVLYSPAPLWCIISISIIYTVYMRVNSLMQRLFDISYASIPRRNKSPYLGILRAYKAIHI
jgi:hypothetical protein